MDSYFICPNCGEDVKTGAPACPHCGSDKKTGWSDETYLDGIDGVDDYTEADYADSLNREFGAAGRKSPKQWFIYIVSLIVLVLFIVYYII